MNDTLQKFARQQLKEGLARLPESSHIMFKRMYAGTGTGKQEGMCLPGDLDRDINEVVDAMPAERLDWAMQQIERSIKRTKG
jgi:hypothetical protein